MRLEFIVTHIDQTKEMFPADGWQEIKITPSLNNANIGVSFITVAALQADYEVFKNDVNKTLVEVETAKDSANIATENANEKAIFAQEQGELAQTEASNLAQLKQETVTATETALQVADENKTRFLPAVATIEERDIIYPNPQNGDTARVTEEAKTYRYSNGTWVVTDQYNPTAIDQITAELAQTEKHTHGYLNAKTYGAVGDGETDDTIALQRMFIDAYLTE